MSIRNAYLDYECYRCGYKTHMRSSMKDHLYKRKTVCAPSSHAVDLTDEIKTAIMNTRAYRPDAIVRAELPPAPQPSTYIASQTVYIQHNQQYNQIINAQAPIAKRIREIKTQEKLDKILTFKGLDLKEIDESIEETFEEDIDLLDDIDAEPTLTKTTNDLYDIVNTFSKVNASQLDKLNVICNLKEERILVFYMNEWKEYLLDSGLTYLINTLANHYLSSYEMYLIRGLEKPLHVEQPRMRDSLQEYYAFLSSFKVRPYAETQTDAYILERRIGRSHNSTHTLSVKYADVYDRVFRSLRPKDITVTRKQVMKILGVNTHTNIAELNQHILELLHTDRALMEDILRLPGPRPTETVPSLEEE